MSLDSTFCPNAANSARNLPVSSANAPSVDTRVDAARKVRAPQTSGGSCSVSALFWCGPANHLHKAVGPNPFFERRPDIVRRERVVTLRGPNRLVEGKADQ